MAQISSPSRFCKHCGTVVTAAQKFCSVCNTELDPRYTQRSGMEPSSNSDVTLKISSVDSDATIRAHSLLSSRIYLQASQQQALLKLDVSAPLQQPDDFLPPVRVSTSKHTGKISTKKLVIQLLCGTTLALLLLLSINAALVHSNKTTIQKQAEQQKIQLDHLIKNAVLDGVPLSPLQSALTEEARIDSANTFLSYLPTQVTSTSYQNQIRQYYALQQKVSKIVTGVTEQFQLQAQRDMQNFQIVLARNNIQPVGNIHYFSQQFSQDQILISSAHRARDYTEISKNANDSITAMHSMETTFKQLTDFHDSLNRMQAAHIDVSAMQIQYQNDLQIFNNATQLVDFQNLNTQINVQYQQIVANSIQSFPYVSLSKLNVFTTQIQTLKTYNINPAPYQKRLNIDQVAQENAKTIGDKLNFFKQVDADIASMSNDLILGQAKFVVKQFHQEVDGWAKSYPYHDNYDDHVYALDNGYMNAGIGETLDLDLQGAHTFTSLEAVVLEAQNALFNLRMFEANYNDKAPYNQIHASDNQMLNHYQLQKKQVLVISLAEQALRLYQNGNLLRSYHITTGRQALPSLPGVWSILDRRSPVIFKSGEPTNSPYWFPDTPISYAILYHYGGYFIHDAPWRATFGPGTQFPHQDASGNTSYNFDGSHGCVNLSTEDAAWIYKHTDWNTVVVIY